MADYIPKSDAEFSLWLKNFSDGFVGGPAAYGLLPADAAALTALVTAWNEAFDNLNNLQLTMRNAVLTKDEARHAAEERVRSLVRRIQANPAVTDPMRAALGLTVRDAHATPAAAPAGRPVASVDTSERLRHTVHFRDEASPRSKAKPKGTKGCEIWVKVGAPPANVSGSGTGDLAFLALDTATPYVAEWEEADAGKTAYYMLRWVSSRDEKGPWSETVEATIVG